MVWTQAIVKKSASQWKCRYDHSISTSMMIPHGISASPNATHAMSVSSHEIASVRYDTRNAPSRYVAGTLCRAIREYQASGISATSVFLGVGELVAVGVVEAIRSPTSFEGCKCRSRDAPTV